MSQIGLSTLSTLSAAAILAASPALSAGGSSTPPTPTETTVECPEGTVYVPEREGCVAIQESRIEEDPDRLIETARELAYAGRNADAIAVLERSATPGDSMVLTYLGYAHRRNGDMDLGLSYYAEALATDPDNLITRAYLGMAHLQLGERDAAEAQLTEILSRGGEGSYPEIALTSALDANATDRSAYDY